MHHSRIFPEHWKCRVADWIMQAVHLCRNLRWMQLETYLIHEPRGHLPLYSHSYQQNALCQLCLPKYVGRMRQGVVYSSAQSRHYPISSSKVVEYFKLWQYVYRQQRCTRKHALVGWCTTTIGQVRETQRDPWRMLSRPEARQPTSFGQSRCRPRRYHRFVRWIDCAVCLDGWIIGCRIDTNCRLGRLC